MKTTDRIDLLPVYAAGARQKPELSHACPMHYYGDPLHVLMLAELTCTGCVYSRPGKNGEFCGRGKDHGKRCAEYKTKGK